MLFSLIWFWTGVMAQDDPCHWVHVYQQEHGEVFSTLELRRFPDACPVHRGIEIHPNLRGSLEAQVLTSVAWPYRVPQENVECHHWNGTSRVHLHFGHSFWSFWNGHQARAADQLARQRQEEEDRLDREAGIPLQSDIDIQWLYLQDDRPYMTQEQYEKAVDRILALQLKRYEMKEKPKANQALAKLRLQLDELAKKWENERAFTEFLQLNSAGWTFSNVSEPEIQDV